MLSKKLAQIYHFTRKIVFNVIEFGLLCYEMKKSSLNSSSSDNTSVFKYDDTYLLEGNDTIVFDGIATVAH